MTRRDCLVTFLIALASAILFCSPVWAQQESEKSQWAPSASVMVGEFRSDAFASGMKNAFDMEVDLAGRSWDVGATRGRPNHSYFRLAYKEVRFKDGSWTDDGTIRNTTRGVKARGVILEKIWRLGLSRWPVAPMLAIGFGAGKLSGQIVQVERSERFVQVAPGRYEFQKYDLPPRTMAAKELLSGYEWVPFLNAEIGLTGSIGQHVTVTAKVAGLEFPGVYYAGVQIVYWPRGK